LQIWKNFHGGQMIFQTSKIVFSYGYYYWEAKIDLKEYGHMI